MMLSRETSDSVRRFVPDQCWSHESACSQLHTYDILFASCDAQPAVDLHSNDTPVVTAAAGKKVRATLDNVDFDAMMRDQVLQVFVFVVVVATAADWTVDPHDFTSCGCHRDENRQRTPQRPW